MGKLTEQEFAQRLWSLVQETFPNAMSVRSTISVGGHVNIEIIEPNASGKHNVVHRASITVK